MRSVFTNQFFIYLLKFLGAFCVCYFGTLAVIGLTAPVGYYSPFVSKYFDYVSLLRKSLMNGSAFILSLFNYNIIIPSAYLLKLEGGHAAHIGYGCLGYGVMSFWVAFVIANKGNFSKKIKWIMGGLLLIWITNVGRISLFVLAINQRWQFPFFNHHTWFNIVSYSIIFILIYFYDRSFGANNSRNNLFTGGKKN